MARTITYRGCTATETQVTTDVTRSVFGHPHRTLAHLWKVEGRYHVPVGYCLDLTSAAAVREHIRHWDTLTEE